MQEGRAHNAASELFGLSDSMRAGIAAASTAEEMWRAIGQDCWIVVPIASLAHPELTLEGSRLTLVSCWPRANAPCKAAQVGGVFASSRQATGLAYPLPAWRSRADYAGFSPRAGESFQAC